MRSSVAACMLGVVCAHAALGVDRYSVAVNHGASATAFTLNVNSPFQTSPSGTCFIIGSYDATANPTGTKTIPGLFGGDTNANTPVAISAGSITASGGTGGTPLHPTGSLIFDYLSPTQCAVEGLALSLFGGGTSSVATNVSITYSTFRTRQPTCTVLGGFPISVPVGNADISSVDVTQVDESSAGTLAATGNPGEYTFSVPMNLHVVIAATMSGQPLDIPPQDVAVTVGGTVTLNAAGASLSGTLSIQQSQTQPGPTTLSPIPFTEPLCSGNLIVNIVLASTTIDLTVDSSLSGSGTLIPTCIADYNQDGGVDLSDIFDLANDISTGGSSFPGSNPDFNNDGGADITDIFDLAGVVAGGPCP